MTLKSIEEQIEIIRETAERVSASPETARDFLERAGIIPRKSDIVREHSSGQIAVKKQKK
jgi:hypothetical protein